MQPKRVNLKNGIMLKIFFKIDGYIKKFSFYIKYIKPLKHSGKYRYHPFDIKKFCICPTYCVFYGFYTEQRLVFTPNSGWFS